MVFVASKTAVVFQVVCPLDPHLRAMITNSREDDDFEVKCANDMLTLPVSGDKNGKMAKMAFQECCVTTGIFSGTDGRKHGQSNHRIYRSTNVNGNI